MIFVTKWFWFKIYIIWINRAATGQEIGREKIFKASEMPGIYTLIQGKLTFWRKSRKVETVDKTDFIPLNAGWNIWLQLNSIFLDEEGYLLKLYQSLDEQEVEPCFRENHKDLTLPFTHFVDSLGIFLRWRGRHIVEMH